MSATPPVQLPMFYREIAALSRERHKGWYIDGDQGFGFTEKSNSVYIAASEFGAAAREYTIVFARDGAGQVVPAAMLGLRPDENLMLNKGKWLARYIPAYIRRYPFILARANPESEEFTVCIDESFSGFNTAKEGQELINDAGEHGEILASSVKFLQEFHNQTLITQQFCNAIDQAGLLDTMQANIKLNGGGNFTLTGFLSVTRDKLKALDATALKDLLERGYLDLIFLHMHSLGNLDTLMTRIDEAATAGATTA